MAPASRSRRSTDPTEDGLTSNTDRIERPGPSAEAIAELQSELADPGQLLLPHDGLARYEQSILIGRAGKAALVARPRTTDEVRKVLRWAYRHRVTLVPQSANTGVVYGASPDDSGSMGVLSLELCKERLEIDPVDRTLTVSAGYDLDWLNEHLAQFDLKLPVDLGASPGVGGMVSTNTGGTKVVGYGDVRRRTLGLEVVLADEQATVLDMLPGLRKNNTGLDLKQLFVATGGTYGVVTAATFELAARPKQVATAWVIVADDVSAFHLLTALERDAGEFLTSYETMSGTLLEIRTRHNPDLRLPFADGEIPDLAVLVELSSAAPRESGLSVENLLLSVLDSEATAGHVIDAFMGRPEEMWAVRHGIDEPLKEGYAFSLDVAFARPRIAEFRERFFRLVADRFPEWVAFDLGHYGDGGVHASVLYPFSHGHPPDPEEADALRTAVYDIVAELNGSFSAEHGIGPYNELYYRRYKDPAVQLLSGELKRLFDPRGILGVVNLGPATQVRPPSDHAEGGAGS